VKQNFFLATISLTLFFGCSSQQPSGTAASQPDRSELERRAEALQKELALGDEMAARLTGHFGAFKAPQATKYLNLVAAALAKHCNRPEIVFRVAILDDAQPNAFATPGGYIFITKGLLSFVKNEHELAGILGHEMAHVTERHIYSAVVKDVGVTESLARAMGGGAGGVAAGLSQAANQGLEILLDKGYGPEKESEADIVGASLASSAGYSSTALWQVLNRLSKHEGSEKISKTHPPYKARLADLSRDSKANGLSEVTKVKESVLNDRFKTAMKELSQ
jgi:predicted Zn-dependent protease